MKEVWDFQIAKNFTVQKVWLKGSEIAICDPRKTWSRLVLPFPTDGANCTCKKYGKDSRVRNRILEFRLMIRSPRMLSRVLFIACYGLGFLLLGSQATGVFKYFRAFQAVSRSFWEFSKAAPLSERARPKEPFWRATESFWRARSL